jgi:hypothetical protein
MTRSDAANLCNKYHIDTHKDFFVLSASEVGQVIDAADEWGYRKPKNANGSRGRYFFAALQRAINRKGE